MKDKDYAISNLRTVKDAISAYASFAPGWPYSDLGDYVEAAQKAVEELINYIINN